MNVEYRALTGLRGLAAIYVLVYHNLWQFFPFPLGTVIGHGYLAVDLFFVLSGFVIAMNYGDLFKEGWQANNYFEFLRRRFARIYPLYFATTIVGFIEAIRHEAYSASVGFKLVANLAMVQSWGLTSSFDAPCWSISSEWLAYLIFPALVAPALFRSRPTVLFFVVISIGVLISLCFLPASFHGHGFQLSYFDLVYPRWAIPEVRCIPEFFLGMVAYRISITRLGHSFGNNRCLTAIVVALMILMTIPGSDILVVLLFPILIIGLTSVNLVTAALSLRPMEFLGRISYSIYLSHFLLRGGIHNRFVDLAQMLKISNSALFSAMCVILVTLPISFVAYLFIELPGRQWLRGTRSGSLLRRLIASQRPSSP